MTELDAISRRHAGASPHIKERQTWKDMERLLQIVRLTLAMYHHWTPENYQGLSDALDELRKEVKWAKRNKRN